MMKAASLLFVLCLFLGLAKFSSAQQIHLPPGIANSQGMGDTPVTSGDDAQKQQAIAANQQRQIEIRRDTEKMAQLTQELNSDLQKSGSATVSVDAVKKVEQIEKLARSVKAKMKMSL